MEKETEVKKEKETKTGKKKNGRPVLIPVLIIIIILFLVLLGAVVWKAARNPLIISKQVIETSVITVVREILPASDFICLVYNYQSITQRSYNPGSWFSARNMLVVLDGTIKLGFNCSDIEVREDGRQLLLLMPPVKILAHEQYPERATSYELAGGGIFPYTIKPQEMLDLLGDSKLEQQKLVEENDELLKQSRDTAEAMFKPLLEMNPSVRDRYNIVFQW